MTVRTVVYQSVFTNNCINTSKELCTNEYVAVPTTVRQRACTAKFILSNVY